MRVLIDGYWWNEGPRSNRMVLLEIVRQWVRDFPADELVLAVPAGRRSDPSPELPDGVVAARTHLRVHPAINAVELPMIARRHAVDAILAFNFAAPSKRGAVFLHDVLFQSNPEWFTAVERAYFAAMPVLARHARSVIATSKTERRRIETLNPRLRRVIDCGLSTSTEFAEAKENDPGLGLEFGEFVLVVGRLNVRKNVETTVQALLRAGIVSSRFPIVLVGEPSGRVADVSEFAQAVADGRIVLAEHVTDADLKWLYRHCKLFVCLSLDEGFGLPVVEAANCGASILASDIPIFHETLGSYATFVDPMDVDAITDGVRQILGNGVHSGEPYVEAHTWQTVCTEIRQELGLVSSSEHS